MRSMHCMIKSANLNPNKGCVCRIGVGWGVSINLVVNVFLFFQLKNDFVCEVWMHLQLNGEAVGSKKVIYCCIGKLVRTDKGQLQKERVG